MWTFLCALCVLWVPPISCAVYEGCHRKEPPPGVVVVPLGSELLLTCSGHVVIDGVKSRSFSPSVTRSTVNSISHNAVISKQTKERDSHVIPTSFSSTVSQPTSAKSAWDRAHVKEFEDEFDEENETTTKFNFQWKFNNKDRAGSTDGPTLSLSSVRMSHSGRYSCHHGGTERFFIRVLVADTPETPHLSCSKKSPSSKIRCEWIPLTPVHKGTSCTLWIRKSLTSWFQRVPCSYSTRRSRCWCALEHNVDDKRTLHQAVLCVSSLVGNATSELLSFKPLQILKPDPPYNVSVQPEPGLNRSLMIKWKAPYTWKFQDRFYELIYEIRYKPVTSINYQTVALSEYTTRHTITDAEAGQEYEVQLRTKDEYEGQWSDWSDPQYGHSWTEEMKEDHPTTPFLYIYTEGSGDDEPNEDLSVSTVCPQVTHHYLWMMIALSVGLSLVILVVYVIRHKDKCMSQLQTLSVLAQCSDSVHPRPAPASAAPTVSERHTLLNNDCPKEVKERNKQELRAGERIEATNFNNTSYFLVQREI